MEYLNISSIENRISNKLHTEIPAGVKIHKSLKRWVVSLDKHGQIPNSYP